MPDKTRILQLASIIQESTATVDKYLAAHGISTPSFEVSPVRSYSYHNDPDDLISSPKEAILEAMDELRSLILGPLGFLHQEVAYNHNSLIALQMISRFQIARKIPLNGEMSYTELALLTSLPEKDLRRILRHAITCRIFREPRPYMVAHTSHSQILTEMPNIEGWVSQACENMWPAASRVVDAIELWPGTEQATHTGFNLSNNTSDPFYTVIQSSPRRSREFNDGMRFFHASPGLETSHVLDAYDWGALGTAQMVDIGGSHGLVAFAITAKFPGIKCVVQDLPNVIEEIDVAQRKSAKVTFQAHDFFEEQPVKSADVYFFRMIFHNWSDLYCVKILRNLIPALKKGARIVANDVCLPAPGEISLYKERSLRCFDLAMMEVCNSQERDLEDWKTMFEKADSRFKFCGLKRKVHAKLDIIEAIWEG